MEFKVDERVIVKANDEMFIVRAINENNKMYICEGDFYGEPQLEVHHESELKKFEEFIYPSTELTDGKRTNIISRVSCSNKETIIEFEIENNIIKFNISKNPITLQGLLKILLNEIDIKNYKYDRISPYMTHHEFTDKRHKFFISYFDLRELDLVDFGISDNYMYTDEILTTNSNMLVEIGEYEIFIPNLIEVARFKNLIINNGNGEEIKALTNEMNRSKYLNISKEMYVNDMQKLGFKVPDRFKKDIDSFDYECLDSMVNNMKNTQVYK